MSQVILDRAQIMSLVRQCVTAGMAKHVRVDPAEVGSLTDTPDQVVDALTSEWPATFRDKQPRQSGIPDTEGAVN